jgi:hypothetical protein
MSEEVKENQNVMEEEVKEQDVQQENPVANDKESYQAVEQLLTEKNFAYAIVCKQYDKQCSTSIITNKNFKLSTTFKFFMQSTLTDVLSTLSKEIINDFAKEKLTIGKASNFVTAEKLTEIIAEHLETLQKEGKIQITPMVEESESKSE